MPKKVEIEMDGVKKTVEVKTPKKKLCSINDVLPASVIALVKANPNNDTIRNLLLAHTKVMVPASEDDFDKIKKWIEWNVAPPPKPKSAWELERERQIENQRRLDEEEARRRANQVDILVNATERNHGRCSYHETVSGRGSLPLDQGVMLAFANTAISADEFFSLIKSDLYGHDVSDHIAMRTVEGTENYEDHDFDESTDTEIELQDEGKTALKQALQRLAPDTYRRLFPSKTSKPKDRK